MRPEVLGLSMNSTKVTFAAFAILFLVPVLFSPEVSASFLGLPEDFHFSSHISRRDHTSYLSPNEKQNQEQVRIWRSAPPGVHISVGTERGFMGAAINTRATHLLLLDHDENVVLYNRINTALLKAASDLEEYRSLRFSGDFKTWLDAGVDLPGAAWAFWQHHVLQDSKFHDFHSDAPGRYPEGNYLFNEELFQRLSYLARQERIDVVHLDLTDSENLSQIIRIMKNKGLALSLLDISNAGDRSYIRSSETLAQVFLDFSRIAHSDSLLVTSRWINTGPFPIQCWDFFAYSFRYVSAYARPTARYIQKNSNQAARERESRIDPSSYLNELPGPAGSFQFRCRRLLVGIGLI